MNAMGNSALSFGASTDRYIREAREKVYATGLHSLAKWQRILLILSDGEWHNGADFFNGSTGLYCTSYSQRISLDLIRKRGIDVQRERFDPMRANGLARYLLRHDSCRWL
jgi:hypothetical protein